MQFFKKHSPFYNLGILYIVSSLFLRLILLFHPITQSSFSFGEIVKVFLTGFISDLLVFIVASAFLWLYLLFLSDSKYNKPWGYIIFALLVGLLLYTLSGKSILHEYGGSLPEIGIAFIGLKTVLFGFLLFLPKWRKQLRLVLFSIAVFIFALVIIQNAISEFFFWNEFGVRYNFIAVDYLVYTNEVIKNIMESYPVVPLFTSVVVVTLIVSYFIVKRSKPFLDNLPSFTEKIKSLGVYIVLFIAATFLIPVLAKQETSHNVFANELQANGMYRFYLAFMNSELDYDKFYKTLPETEAFALLQKQIPAITPNFSARTIQSTNPEIRKNVVLITIESLSADFLKAYGNEQNITPFLDSLALQSLQFSNLYAVGNRTIRGLESVVLCLPPTAGESVVKRKDNKNKFSTGYVFKTKGYSVNFLYGGDAYFDNMEDFFSGNGYGIVDKKTLKPDEITFSNVWGVCDEDMAKKAIAIMNEEAKTGKPFFNHWMTVSNHRPFTYPEGKIDIDSHAKMREGGVKYTDYALKQFFAMAQKQTWFKNTVFLIVADHCASSSGHVQLPLDKYRIPAMIYAPGFIQPSVCNKMISQIDLMPTLFGLLNFNYQTKFFGQDVLKDDYKPRAFMATYQDLGLLKDNVLTILSPKQKVKQFQLKLQPKGTISTDFQIYFEQTPLDKQRDDLVNETVSYYQTASNLLKNKKFDK
ncbi:MAG: LTA synthase family protein [Flavobacterium sp.]|uniref:LTA synthase family protein n=1 Tax=Flavobacterium sp. TaxID=239 RepID=UPI0022BE78DB|nr:LTA synthase family protein [Flavobacterium sp.]MCZ8196671.1 LTA synthase family protein [Flavobacterium sp.]